MRAIFAIAVRSLRRTIRRPQTVMPMLLVPLMFLGVVSGGAARATQLERFPQVDSFFDFALAGSIMQATLLAGLMTGVALALDIESGFFDRMLTTPTPRAHLITGRLLGGAVIAVAQGLLFVTVGLAFGASIKGGVLGVVAICLLATMSATAAGGATIAIALKTRSASVVQGLFPLVFVGVFLSSTFFPRELLTGPARTIADYNPISFIVEGIRDPIVSSLSASRLGFGLIHGVAACLVTIGASVWMLRSKVGDA